MRQYCLKDVSVEEQELEKTIEVMDLIKYKGKRKILHDVSFDLKKGEVVGFLGANGAGKTTTLKCIMGLYDYKGKIKINGMDALKKRREVSQIISGLIEEPSFYPNLTGMENLKINMMYYGKYSREKLENIVALLKIGDFVQQKVKSYSLGMKQRLGIAFTLVNEPEIILLDEPMNGLDPDGIKDLRELLIKMAHENGKTILVSSHILSEMQLLCDRVIFIKKGVIVGNESISDHLEERYMRVMRGE